MNTTTRLAALVCGLALTAGALTGAAQSASAVEGASAPCAQQQRQVDKAEAALARATANFARQKDTADEPGTVVKAKKQKKAQVQRVAKAQARLQACLAAQPVAG